MNSLVISYYGAVFQLMNHYNRVIIKFPVISPGTFPQKPHTETKSRFEWLAVEKCLNLFSRMNYRAFSKLTMRSINISLS